MRYKIKFDLAEYVSFTTSSSISIIFSNLSDRENFATTYGSPNVLTFNKSSSLTNVVIAVGGQVITLANSNVLNLSATSDYIIFEADVSDEEAFMYLLSNNVISLDFDGNTSLICYKQNSDNETLNKSLTYVSIINGKFNHAINLKNVNVDVFNFGFSFNYVFIPSLRRYYYVDSIELVSADYSRLHLKEDVLMSWKSLIKKQNGFIERFERSNNYNLVDDRFPVEDIKRYYVIDDVNNNYGVDDGAVNVTFNQSTLGGYNWVVDAMSKDITAVYGTIQPPTNASNLPSIASNKTIHNVIYCLNASVFNSFADAIFKDQPLGSYVNSYMLFPFDVTALALYQANSYLQVNDKYLDYSDNEFKNSGTINYATCRKLLVSSVPYLVVADFIYQEHFSNNKKFLNYEPYCFYELFIPFVGWVKIKGIDLIGNRILVYYGVDISTGFATAYIRDYTHNVTLFSTSCQIGIKLPVNTSNAEELTRQKQNNVLNMALGLISAGVSVGVGVASENPVAIVGGVLSAGKAVSSYINANNMMFERSNTIYTSTETAYYDIQSKVKLKVTYSEEITQNTSVYAKVQGYPYRQFGSLNKTGYMEIPLIHFDPMNEDIYQDEISEIVELLEKGVIF